MSNWFYLTQSDTWKIIILVFPLILLIRWSEEFKKITLFRSQNSFIDQNSMPNESNLKI